MTDDSLSDWMREIDQAGWYRRGEEYVDGLFRPSIIELKVARQDHLWIATVTYDGQPVHMSQHGGREEAMTEAKNAAKRAVRVRSYPRLTPVGSDK